MDLRNFFAELKRRHVYRVAVAGWLIPSTSPVLRLDPAWDPLRQDPRFQELSNGSQP